MGPIVAEERGHAAFSAELARAFAPRLTPAERRRMREVQEQMLAGLGTESCSPELRETLGLMDGEQSRRLAKRLLDTARV